jgi:uncharacterized protein (DUF2164 family)
MDWTSIVVALIAALGSFLGVFYSNRRAARDSAALIDYRIGQLEEKVDRHNNMIERTYRLEENQAVIEEKIKVANNRIADLEKRGA